MKWYLTLVHERDKPRSRRAWVLVRAEDPMNARAEGADVVSCRWPTCRARAALLVSLSVARSCRHWLDVAKQGVRPRRPRVRKPPYTSELCIAYDALFSRGSRHVVQDCAMEARWLKPKPDVEPSRLRDEEEI